MAPRQYRLETIELAVNFNKYIGKVHARCKNQGQPAINPDGRLVLVCNAAKTWVIMCGNQMYLAHQLRTAVLDPKKPLPV